MVARLALLGIVALAPLAALGQSPVSLVLDVGSPDGAIAPADPIVLDAWTVEEVFSDPGYEVTSEFVLNGFAIDWQLTSRRLPGLWVQVLTPLAHSAPLGPLPAGEYTVNATWDRSGPPLPFSGTGGSLGGTGQLRFTVIPEPTAFVLMALAVASTGACRRRR